MYRIRARQRFTRWQIIDSTKYYKPHDTKKKRPYVLVFDQEANVLKYTQFYALIYGHSKGSMKSVKNGGHSTRVKNKHLPKYVHYFPLGKKKYRVAKKDKSGYNTIGYFKTLKEARIVAKKL